MTRIRHYLMDDGVVAHAILEYGTLPFLEAVQMLANYGNFEKVTIRFEYPNLLYARYYINKHHKSAKRTCYVRLRQNGYEVENRGQSLTERELKGLPRYAVRVGARTGPLDLT